MDVTLFLPGVKPGATIIAEAIGGKGGGGKTVEMVVRAEGQKKSHPPANGGAGGAAGLGGRGRQSGVVHAFVVLGQADMSKAEEFIKSVTINANIAAGAGGAPGTPGAGGPGGDESGWCIGMGCAAGFGGPGAVAQPGPSGDGPVQGNISQKWVSVEAMELTAYQAYVAQLWKQLGN